MNRRLHEEPRVSLSVDPLTILANRTNLQILSLLKTEARNPRELAKVLGKHETHVSSRLRFMERMGLVKGSWARKDGKNVKLYELRADSIQLSLTPEGYEAKFSSASGPVTVPLFYEPNIPSCPKFVGREKELELLKSAGRFVVVEGVAGIGKTWLVARFVSQLEFKEVFWHAIKGFDTFNSVVRKLAISLGAQGKTELYDYVKSSGPDNSVKLELLTKEVDNERNILVFDDYHVCSDRNIEDLVAHLKNNLRKTQVVIMSRSRPKFAPESGVTELVLSGFTLQETAAFLSARGIKPRDTLVDLVQEKLHGHPLSLEFLAEASRAADVESALMSVKKSRLIDYLWTQIYENLSEGERVLIRIMSVFRTPPSMDALHFVCGPKLPFHIYELGRRHLVAEAAQRYSLHDLVKEMAYRLVDSPEEIHRKVADYYLKEGSLGSRVEAVYHLLQAKEHEKIAKVVEEHYNFGDPIVFSEYAVPYMELIKTVPMELVSKGRQAYLLTVIGRIEREFVDLKKSVQRLSEALEMAEKQGDLGLAAKIVAGVGRAYFEMGVMDKAENYLLRAADEFKKEQQAMRLCETYQYLSLLYGARGLMDKALTYAQYCLQTAKAVTSPRVHSFHCLGMAHQNLGWLYGIMGEFTKAEHHLKQALKMLNEIMESVESPQLDLISVYEEQGKLKDAEALCERTIQLCKGKPTTELLAKATWARLLLRSGREIDAEEELNEVVRTFRSLKGRRVGTASLLGDVEMTLGIFHSTAKRWTEAVKHYKRALHILRQDVPALGKVYQEFAMMWLQKGDHERFKSHAKEAIKLLHMVGAEHRVRQLEGLFSRVQVGAITAPIPAPIQA